MALAWRKSSVRNAPTLGRSDQVRRAVLELFGGDGVAHHQHGGGEAFPRVRNVAAVFASARRRSRPPRSRRPARAACSNGNGLVAPPSIRTWSSTIDRPHHGRQRDRGGERRLAAARSENTTSRRRIQIGRDHRQRNRQAPRNPPARLSGRNWLADFFGVEPASRCRSRRSNRSGETAGARPHQAAEDLGAVVRQS